MPRPPHGGPEPHRRSPIPPRRPMGYGAFFGGSHGYGGITGIVVLVIVLGSLLYQLLPFLLIGGVGFAIYYYVRQSQRREQVEQQSSLSRRVAVLNAHIATIDDHLQVLEQDYSARNLSAFVPAANRYLKELDGMLTENQALQSRLEYTIYEQNKSKIAFAQQTVEEKLASLNIRTNTATMNTMEQTILELAPEILATYQNVQADHALILEKIGKVSGNQEELRALHQSNMKRFDDILEGYLKIKASPKDFKKADERLELAKTALEQFDLDLDDTLRDLNENDLADFEVSLRMMLKEKKSDLSL